MNSHILIGYAFDKTHRVILDGAPYAQVKKAYMQTKNSDKYSKIEIWSRANGLEKSKHLTALANELRDALVEKGLIKDSA